MTTALDRIRNNLDRVQQKRDHFLASCPVESHGQGRGDQNPSLSVRYDGEKVLLNCMSGCHTQDVLFAMGMDWPDLFDNPITGDRGVTVAAWTYTTRKGDPYFTVERQQTRTGKKFLQKIAGAVKYGLPPGFQPCLYKLPQVLAACDRGEEVWIVEGEKCVSAMESLGVVATTSPMGAGKWRDYYSKWFTEGQGASCVHIVCDNDEPGRQHASEVAVSLRARGLVVKTWAVRLDGPKADVYDHVQAGYGLADLQPIELNRLRPTGTTANCLIDTTYPQVQWAIPQVLPTGLAVLGGPPKLGKSMTVLSMALGVACGGVALEELRCTQGSVLYLSLDNDSERRLQNRMQYLMLSPEGVPRNMPIEFHVDWPVGDLAIRCCQEWLDEERTERRTPRLIVIDTLARVEPYLEGGPYDNAYITSTANLTRWSRFADDNEVAVLAVHHDRKAGDEDWLNRFTGSRGITATAATLMLLDAQRGASGGWLRLAGRDVETTDLELRRSGWGWACMNPNVRIGVS